jgi:hypothetical protein
MSLYAPTVSHTLSEDSQTNGFLPMQTSDASTGEQLVGST